jgi:hypothetical protein
MVACPYVVDISSSFVDDARSIASHDPRWRDGDAGQPLHDEQVEVIKGCCLYRDANLAAAWRRRKRQVVARLDLVQGTVARQRQCAHERQAIGPMGRDERLLLWMTNFPDITESQ